MLILDKNPINAARYLSKRDIRLFYRMATTYSEDSNLYSLTKFNKFTTNNYNYNWICKFILEVCELYSKLYDNTDKNKIRFPDFPDVSKHECLPNSLAYKNESITFIGNRKDIDFKVSVARCKYMLRKYKKEDFINETYPEWYIPLEDVVFETYLPEKRKYYRILLDEDSNFIFEVSILGGVLKRIEDIPDEIRDLIVAMLLKNRLSV